jgi:hypothetical protein
MDDVSAKLLARFERGGFSQLTGSELEQLSAYLESRGAVTGQEAPLFLSRAIRTVHHLFLEHDEYGGTRVGFVRRLDEVACERVPLINASDPDWAARLSRDFLDEIRNMTAAYDPRDPYE